MSTNGRINQEDALYIYSGISLMSKKEILPFATTWMNLEGIMLSEVSRRKTHTV